MVDVCGDDRVPFFGMFLSFQSDPYPSPVVLPHFRPVETHLSVLGPFDPRRRLDLCLLDSVVERGLKPEDESVGVAGAEEF